ncbi:MAG: hypothetical protein ACLT38_05270 [Akkermansia sp.]
MIEEAGVDYLRSHDDSAGAIVLSQWAEHAGTRFSRAWKCWKEKCAGRYEQFPLVRRYDGLPTGPRNCMHSSMSSLGGGIALFNMLLGEVISEVWAAACTAC